MATTAAQFNRRTREMIRRLDRIDNKGLADAARLLRRLRERTNAQLVGTDFEQFNANRFRRAMAEVTDDFRRQYTSQLRGLQDETLENFEQFRVEIQDDTGVQLGARIVPRKQVEAAAAFRDERITGMSGRILDDITRETQLGVVAGDSPFKIQQRIRRFISPIRRNGKTTGALARAEVISRNSTTFLHNVTAFAQQTQDADMLKGRGEQTFKIWVTAGDTRVRPEHVSAGRRYRIGGNPGPIPFEQPFIVGGEELMFPQDPAGSPGNTIQCRCVMAILAQSMISDRRFAA